MLVFKDIISKDQDEMVSDSFDMKEVDDVVYEVNCKMVVKGSVNVNIGANPSAEGEDEDESVQDSGEEKVNNVVDTFRLQQTQFDKKSFLTYLKGYLKAVKTKLQETNPERVAEFEKKAQIFTKEKILAKFDDYVFYTGESMDPEGMIALLNYREDGITPYFTFWKDGLKKEKYVHNRRIRIRPFSVVPSRISTQSYEWQAFKSLESKSSSSSAF